MLLLRDLFSSAIPRQVEKFWTRTDWEIFLGGIWGGLLTSTENLENFGNSWGGHTVRTLQWDDWKKPLESV